MSFELPQRQGMRLSQLHDVAVTNNPPDNSLLVRSGGRWVNKPLTGIPGNVTATGELKSEAGIVRLNAAGNRYLWWDGTQYKMDGALLWVNGSPVARVRQLAYAGNGAASRVLGLSFQPKSYTIMCGADGSGSTLRRWQGWFDGVTNLTVEDYDNVAPYHSSVAGQVFATTTPSLVVGAGGGASPHGANISGVTYVVVYYG